MLHVSLTPFGRQPVTSALLESRQRASAPPALPRIDKWSVFHDLCTARQHFGVTDRDLTVLNALLSFLPAKAMEAAADLVVFPSNASLCSRAHGMAESTLRRHLAALVAAGLIWRQDSPNGKRYARKNAQGGLAQVFGFDLRPLLLRAAEIAEAARETSTAADALRVARETLVLRLRDAAKLLAYGRDNGLPGAWAALEARLLPLRAGLRRKLDQETLERMGEEAGDILRAVCAMHGVKAEEMHGSAAHFERHHTDSNIDSPDLEPCQEKAKAQPDVAAPVEPKGQAPALPLGLVIKACPEILIYAQGRISGWRDLVGLADRLRGMMGISPHAWTEAQEIMGSEMAAIVVCAILQRFDRITNHGGYLRALSAKAATVGFSAGPMIMSLLRDDPREQKVDRCQPA